MSYEIKQIRFLIFLIAKEEFFELFLIILMLKTVQEMWVLWLWSHHEAWEENIPVVENELAVVF